MAVNHRIGSGWPHALLLIYIFIFICIFFSNYVIFYFHLCFIASFLFECLRVWGKINSSVVFAQVKNPSRTISFRKFLFCFVIFRGLKREYNLVFSAINKFCVVIFINKFLYQNLGYVLQFDLIQIKTQFQSGLFDLKIF